MNNKTFFENQGIADKLDKVIKQKKRDRLLETLKTFKNTILNVELDKDNNILIDDSRFPKSVVYANLVAVLIEAMKEQQAIIVSQNQQISALQKDMTEIKTHLGLK